MPTTPESAEGAILVAVLESRVTDAKLRLRDFYPRELKELLNAVLDLADLIGDEYARRAGGGEREEYPHG